MAQLPSQSHFGDYADWPGRDVLDSGGERLGGVREIYLDRETGRPEWVLVDVEGDEARFVPLADASVEASTIRVAHSASQIRQAPGIGAEPRIDQSEERRLYAHYGLGYADEEPEASWSAAAPLEEATNEAVAPAPPPSPDEIAAADIPEPPAATARAEEAEDGTGTPTGFEKPDEPPTNIYETYAGPTPSAPQPPDDAPMLPTPEAFEPRRDDEPILPTPDAFEPHPEPTDSPAPFTPPTEQMPAADEPPTDSATPFTSPSGAPAPDEPPTDSATPFMPPIEAPAEPTPPADSPAPFVSPIESAAAPTSSAFGPPAETPEPFVSPIESAPEPTPSEPEVTAAVPPPEPATTPPPRASAPPPPPPAPEPPGGPLALIKSRPAGIAIAAVVAAVLFVIIRRLR